MKAIRSRDNARIKAWARLADDPRERRKAGLALIEGVHLVETFLAQGGRPESLMVSESALSRDEILRVTAGSPVEPYLLADGLFGRISDADTPAGIAAEIEIPVARVDARESTGCVFLEGIQDAGNVGAILRSAAAFGISDAFIGRGCADPWSPKALRAGMGGHFFLRVMTSADLTEDVRRFGDTTLCTAAHGGESLEGLDLSGRIGWIFGSEASGATGELANAASKRVTIATPGGAESLNVAASAAICFYERQRQVSKRGA